MIRTPNLPLAKRALYQVELQALGDPPRLNPEDLCGEVILHLEFIKHPVGHLYKGGDPSAGSPTDTLC